MKMSIQSELTVPQLNAFKQRRGGGDKNSTDIEGGYLEHEDQSAGGDNAAQGEMMQRSVTSRAHLPNSLDFSYTYSAKRERERASLNSTVTLPFQ